MLPLFQTEAFYAGKRYHWPICRADNIEELVSWGHEPTRELAEAVAEQEIQVLSCGMTPATRTTLMPDIHCQPTPPRSKFTNLKYGDVLAKSMA